jgi:hypothetical protein
MRVLPRLVPSNIHTTPLSTPPAALNYVVESADIASEFTIGLGLAPYVFHVIRTLFRF